MLKSRLWQRIFACYVFSLGLFHVYWGSSLGIPFYSRSLFGVPRGEIGTHLIYLKDVVYDFSSFGLVLSGFFLIGQKESFRYLAAISLLCLFFLHLWVDYLCDGYNIEAFSSGFIIYIMPAIVLLINEVSGRNPRTG